MGANLPKSKRGTSVPLLFYNKKIVHTALRHSCIITANMSLDIAERHQIENEMIFRRMNEKVGDDLGALDAENIEANDIFLIRDASSVIHFKCECSDENCTIRIPLKLVEYQTIHADRDTFIVMPGHQVDPIETILVKEEHYSVVKKKNSTPEPGKDLNDTIIDNG